VLYTFKPVGGAWRPWRMVGDTAAQASWVAISRRDDTTVISWRSRATDSEGEYSHLSIVRDSSSHWRHIRIAKTTWGKTAVAHLADGSVVGVTIVGDSAGTLLLTHVTGSGAQSRPIATGVRVPMVHVSVLGASAIRVFYTRGMNEPELLPSLVRVDVPTRCFAGITLRPSGE
jgi:hypothetical protein